MNTTALNTTALTPTTRLPVPPGMDAGTWQVITEVIFPGVDSARSIGLALEYCRQRKLDIMKRPVAIVPMWNAKLRREVDTIWPGIGETQITAARSGEWAGLDPPRFGPMITENFKGRKKDRDGWTDASVTVTFPEWVEICVYRLKQDVRYAFTERVYWREAYGRSGGGSLPNGIWVKRPIGQCIKVAKAAALRAAFPEEDSGPTGDEMHGAIIDDADAADAVTEAEQDRPTIEQPQEQQADAAPVDPVEIAKPDDMPWPEWGQVFIGHVRACKDHAAAEVWLNLNKANLEAMKEQVPKMHSGLIHSVNQHKLTLVK